MFFTYKLNIKTTIVIAALFGFSATAMANQAPFPRVAPFPDEERRLAEIESIYRSSWLRCERAAEELLGVGHLPGVVELAVERERSSREPYIFATTSGYGRDIEIRVYLAAQLPGLQSAETTLCHEMIHALMRRHVSSYRNLAPWVREGSATYFSGEWNRRFNGHLIQHIRAPGGPQSRVSEINPDAGRDSGFSLDDYFESAGFFAYLDSQQAGLGRRWLRLLVEGESPQEATQTLLRRDLRPVLVESRGWVQRQIRAEQQAWPAGMFELAVQLKDGSRLYTEAARPVFQRIVAELQSQEQNATTERRLAWARFFFLRMMAGSPVYLAETDLLLSQLLVAGAAGVWEVSEMGIAVSELIYLRAFLRRDQARLNESLSDFLRVRRYHMEQPHLHAASMVGIGKVYMDMNLPVQSFAWLNHQADASLRQSPETCWYLIRAAIEVGARRRAEEVFAILDREYSTSPVWAQRVAELRARLNH